MSLPRLTAWTFTITHATNGCHWTVHRNGATHAQGDAPDYDTAWLDSHDAIPDRLVASETVTTISPTPGND